MISLNLGTNPLEVNFNGQPVSEVYYNNIFCWPDSKGVYYKFNFLEHAYGIQDLDANIYELRLSRTQTTSEYKYSLDANSAPEWQKAQPDVISPKGIPYATPLSYVRRVVIESAITPTYLNYWFDHLYGGLNDTEEISEAYPFEWVGFDKLRINYVVSLEGAFKQCHTPTVDLTNWDTSLVTNTKDMFNWCSAEHIYIRPDWFNIDNVTDSFHMFFEANYLPNYHSGKTDKTMAKLVSEGGYLETK